MNAAPPIAVDPVEVRAFMEVIHARAAAAFNGAPQPGMLQLVRIYPDLRDTITLQFAIGQTDLMAAEAVRQASDGFNVYVEGRTVREGASKRGKLADTVGVFAFVIDADADKGQDSRDRIEPSLIVETSPGNTHRWVFLDRALPPDEAKPIGAAIRAAAGADTDTGVITQPYRVAGTPNYPDRKKRKRGRVITPTRILDTGRTYTADELRLLFPEQPKAQAGSSTSLRPEGLSGRDSERAGELLRTAGGDRSAIFHAAAMAAHRDGLTIDDFEALCRANPDGCAGKFLHPYDRLRQEIERSWTKIETRAESVRQGPERPTYEDASAPVGEARDAVAVAILHFLEEATAYRRSGDNEAKPPVHGLAVSTGVGKTRLTAKAVAEHILSRRGTVETPKPILYAVPTHRLGSEVEVQFAEHGVVARVFRGRQAANPDNAGNPMCDDLEAVEIALTFGVPITSACCKLKLENGTHIFCDHFSTCAYQKQKRSQPDVWIVAHQMLFNDQPALGDVEMVIIDEGFWGSGIKIPKQGLTLDEIAAPVPIGDMREDALRNDVETYRGMLARALRRQEKIGIGGVRREHLLAEGLTGETCTNARKAEWALKEKTRAPIYPGMLRAERRLAAQAAKGAKHVRAFITLWSAARELLYDESIEVSGRLYLDSREEEEDGRVIVAKARGVRKIVKRWQAPTLLLDATLPDRSILEAFFDEIEIAPPIAAAMPHVRVRQVLDAPVAARKLQLDDGKANRNLRAIRREILRRYLELGRAPVLVIAQKAVAEWLRTSNLPASIAIEHFNAIAGLDQYRNVRGLMEIGRTVPSPFAVEALAGALTGKQPECSENWYAKMVRGIRVRGGSPVGVECDAHPDPVAEACRWQICEGELVQAIGRARGVNRTASTPLDIDILANVVLPLTVDQVVDWEAPDEGVDMAAEGVILDSGADMAAAWPEVWSTPGAARNWLLRRPLPEGNTVTEPYRDNIYRGLCDSVRRFRYQRAGRNQKWRTGAYDPSVVPDIQAWLETRLGELAGFNFSEPAPQAAAHPAPSRRPLPRAADYEAGLAATYRCVVDLPAAAPPIAPFIPETVRFDPAAGIRFPAAILDRLERIRRAEITAAFRSVKVNEGRARHARMGREAAVR